MKYNYIFTGFGHASGSYCIDNNTLYQATKDNLLSNFNEELILASPNYQEYFKKNPQTTPFDYFVGHKMGFFKRHHVSPWPPTDEHIRKYKTSLDLAVDAVEMAIDDAGLDPEQIDSWIVSSVSPHETAPGIATTLKCYFVNPDNTNPATTLTSGCAGFNLGIRRAINYLEVHKEANHIVVLHTETMSRFLTKKTDFVAHATFGDAAAAVIITRTKKNQKEGIVAEANYQDIRMIGAVGVDYDRNLYMDGGWVKRRAVINISKVSNEILKKSEWNINQIDIIVPHQTGNIILNAVADELGITKEKLFLDAQKEYGNISGATIPMALSMLKHKGMLKSGMRILCPTAGVGGEYGAFSYIVPELTAKNTNKALPLKNKTAIVLYADSLFGIEVCKLLADNGCQVLAHCNNSNNYTAQLQTLTQPVKVIIDEFKTPVQAEKQIVEKIKQQQFNYHINLISTNEIITSMNLNSDEMLNLSTINFQLTRKLLEFTKETFLILGHSVELANHPSASPCKDFFSGWHGLLGSMAGEAISKGVMSIWYIPSIFDHTPANMQHSLKTTCMSAINQNNWQDIYKTVINTVKSLYLLKVANTNDTLRGAMIDRIDKP